MAVEEKQSLLLGAIVLAGLMLSACQNEPAISSWPPFAGGAVQIFLDHQENIEALRDLMEEAPYASAVKVGEDAVYGYREVDGEMVSEILTDSELWVELMGRTKINSVIRSDDTYFFSTADRELTDGRVETIQYVFSDNLAAKECLGGFSDVACGFCDVSHQGEWTIRYMWISGQHIEDFYRAEMGRLEERFEAVSKGQNREAAGPFDDNGEAIKKLNAKNEECVRKGLEEMGYDNPEEYF